MARWPRAGGRGEVASLARAAGLGVDGCGTTAGYLAHSWRGTPACPPCEAAWVAFAAWCQVHGDLSPHRQA